MRTLALQYNAYAYNINCNIRLPVQGDAGRSPALVLPSYSSTEALNAGGQSVFALCWSRLHWWQPACRDDLLEDPVEAEVREMEVAVQAGLEAVDGPGWRLVRVGGGQRGLPSHDADFVVTHDTDPDRCEELRTV